MSAMWKTIGGKKNDFLNVGPFDWLKKNHKPTKHE